MQGTRVVAFVSVAVALVVALWVYWPGEERRIRDRLEELAVSVSERGGQGIGQMAHAAKVAGFFTPDAVVDVGPPYPEIRGRDTIMALAAKVAAPDDEFAVTFKNITVILDPDTTLATARLTAVVLGRGPRIADDTVDAREFEVDLVKMDGEWQLSRVTIVQAIERPR